MGMRAEQLPALITSTVVDMAAIVAGIVAAFLCIAVIRQVTARQEAAAAVPALTPTVGAAEPPPI